MSFNSRSQPDRRSPEKSLVNADSSSPASRDDSRVDLGHPPKAVSSNLSNLSVSDDPDAAEVLFALEMAKVFGGDSSSPDLVPSVLPDVLRMLGARDGGIVSQRQGRWVCEPWVGRKSDLPESFVAETIDAAGSGKDASGGKPLVGRAKIENGWCVSPLSTGSSSDPSRSPSALVIRLTDSEETAVGTSKARAARLIRSADSLAAAIGRSKTSQRQVRRIEQLTAVLAAAADWQLVDDDESLLRKIADAATGLLRCERASIFLWDRRRSKLVGRPALGTPTGSLEVADDAGVVGEVLNSGESKIWNSGSDDEARVNRRIDEKLAFQTRSLVAVPMSRRADGVRREEVIGVFEAINKKDGGFENDDAVLLSDLAMHAAVAIESLRTRKRLVESRDRLVDDAASSTPLIGNHPSVKNVRDSASKVARTDLTVLVLGKNGTGKEVLARHIHYESDRRSGPFVAVNCAALVETLLESELFGHEKGAFTDANQTRVGKFELASGGTLFLDEVGDMSPGGQAKLLRVLEEKVVVRVGGSQTIPVDVRVIAATNQPLEELISQRRFREDLFFRLNVVSLTLPPLSQRGSDVMLLASHFLSQFCYQIGRQVPTFSPAALTVMQSHAWPGNIRELRNTIERVCYLSSGDIIEADDLMLTAGLTTRAVGTPIGNLPIELSEATRIFQVEHIERAIASSGGNMTDAAANLGLHRSNLYRKMRQLGMSTSGE